MILLRCVNQISNLFFLLQECTFCRKPILFDRFEARTRDACGDLLSCAIPNCPQMAVAAH